MKKQPKHKLTIDRKKWIRGVQATSKLLVKPSITHDFGGKMCCLGFACLQLTDANRRNIRGVATPCDESRALAKKIIASPLSFLINENKDANSRDCKYLMSTNDSSATTDKKKEKDISRVFGRHGIEVKFIN